MRILLAGLIIVVVAFGTWAAWGRYGYLVRNDPSARLQYESLAGPGLRTISLEQMTDFNWEHVVFFGPYTSKAQATKALGFEWPRYEETGIKWADFYSLIVFTESKRVTRWWRLRRCAPDIEESFLGILVSRADATLILQNQESCSFLRGPANMRSNPPVNADARDRPTYAEAFAARAGYRER